MCANLGLGLQQTNYGYLRTRVHTKDLAQVLTPQPQEYRRFPVQSAPETIQPKVQVAKEEDCTPALSAATIKLLRKKEASYFMGDPWT